MRMTEKSIHLVKANKFNDFPCDFYANDNWDIYLTRKQIGKALGYKNPDNALNKIHSRHKDQLEQKYIIHKLESTDGKMYDLYLYDFKGIMRICKFSKKQEADDFFDWLWNLIGQYREYKRTFNAELKYIEALEQELATLRQKQTQMKKSLPKKKFSYWSSKMFPKYQLLLEHFNLSSYKDLYRELYLEFVNMYPNMDLNQLVDDYCTIHRVDSCFTMDAIEANAKIRDLFTEMVDYILETYHLVETPVRKKTIFDKK